MTARRKGADPGRAWPLDFTETVRRLHKGEMRSWLQPKSGDLLRDVIYLQGRAAKANSKTARGIHARAAVVMGVATIEALTNDALATIYELLTDTIPSECIGEPPWCYFIGRSTRRIAALLRRGSFPKKRDYVLGQIERVTGYVLAQQLVKDIDRLVLFRNRIVHMSYQERPGKYQPLLNAAQMMPLAALAADSVRHFLDFLSEAFSELKLPILTIRPWHYFHGDSAYLDARLRHHDLV
jgi:hypothetical protein